MQSVGGHVLLLKSEYDELVAALDAATAEVERLRRVLDDACPEKETVE